MRCFVAIELPVELRTALAALVERWQDNARDVRFCRADQLHVTLKFLGEVAIGRLPAVQAVLAASVRGIWPFSLQFDALGAFPTPQRPRVLWYGGADDARACARWLDQAQPGLRPLGFADELRPLRPHVTLARLRAPGGGQAMRRILEDPGPIPAYALPAREITLFESRLAPGGATYRAIERFALKVEA